MTVHASDISKSARQVEIKPLRFPTQGSELVGRAFWPAHPPKSSIVIHGATGVPQVFYAKFARWAAEQGHLCLTYDYRDFGASLAINLRKSTATMADWALYDQQAALNALLGLADTPKAHMIGHSLGGFMLPFHDNLGKVDQVTTVACGLVNWRDHPTPYWWTVAAFWYGIGPALTKLWGYMPGKRLGLGADIPAGVYWQWRKWCTSPGFFADEIGTVLPQMNPEPYTGPIKIIGFTDDDMAPEASINRMVPHYKQAQITRKQIDPKDYGLEDVGHLKAFTSANAALWPELLAQ